MDLQVSWGDPFSCSTSVGHLGRLCSTCVYSRAQCERQNHLGEALFLEVAAAHGAIPTEQAHFKPWLISCLLTSHRPKQITWPSLNLRDRGAHGYGMAAEWRIKHKVSGNLPLLLTGHAVPDMVMNDLREISSSFNSAGETFQESQWMPETGDSPEP